jgi:hypothetical protein
MSRVHCSLQASAEVSYLVVIVFCFLRDVWVHDPSSKGKTAAGAEFSDNMIAHK